MLGRGRRLGCRRRTRSAPSVVAEGVLAAGVVTAPGWRASVSLWCHSGVVARSLGFGDGMAATAQARRFAVRVVTAPGWCVGVSLWCHSGVVARSLGFGDARWPRRAGSLGVVTAPGWRVSVSWWCAQLGVWVSGWPRRTGSGCRRRAGVVWWRAVGGVCPAHAASGLTVLVASRKMELGAS